jgi:hypothetical protein
MERIVYEKPVKFIPDPTHVQILLAVAGKPGCHISHVVQQLQNDHSENRVRSGVRQLLAKQLLDGGNSFADTVTLRLTSSGRVLLQNTGAV